MKTIKMCALLMLILFSLSFAQAAISNSDGSAISTTPSLIIPDETIAPEIQDTPQEESSEMSPFTKLLIIILPIFIICVGLLILKKKRKKKPSEQSKEMGTEELLDEARKDIKEGPKKKENCDCTGLGDTCSDCIARAINKEDEKEKARTAIEKILAEEKIRNKPGFDDPTKNVTTNE